MYGPLCSKRVNNDLFPNREPQPPCHFAKYLSFVGKLLIRLIKGGDKQIQNLHNFV